MHDCEHLDEVLCNVGYVGPERMWQMEEHRAADATIRGAEFSLVDIIQVSRLLSGQVVAQSSYGQ